MSNEVYGYAGSVLRVDLSNHALTEEKLDEATLRAWLDLLLLVCLPQHITSCGVTNFSTGPSL